MELFHLFIVVVMKSNKQFIIFFFAFIIHKGHPRTYSKLNTK